MNFTDIPANSTVFVDANTLIYHFTASASYGAACTGLIQQIEQQQLQGFISTHVLADVAHRLMTLEAMSTLGWPVAGLAARLRQHRAEIAKLKVYQQAIVDIPKLGIRILPTTHALVESATSLSGQHQLLTGDALIVAVMQAHGITNLASNDDDFDTVPSITRFGPQ